MKVLALVTDGSGCVGGIAQYNRDLLSALSHSPAVSEVQVLPRYGLVRGKEICVKVRELACSPERVRWSVRAARLAAAWRPDAIFCGHLNATPLAALLARAGRSALWVQAHGIEAWTDRGRLMRWGLEHASLVTAVSRHTRARLIGWCGLPPARVRVLPNTVCGRYAPRARRADLLARLGLEGRKVVLTVGRFPARERYKGHDRVIDALPMVARAVPQVSYLIVGSGDDRAHLAAWARRRGVGDRVVFAGAVAAEDLPDYFALGDVLAMPSTGEGFGIVFLEAVAMGLPVIGGNADGSVDALAEGRIGKLVDPHSREDLAEALVAALRGQQRHDARMVKRFEFANFSRHVNDLVADLAAERCLPRRAA